MQVSLKINFGTWLVFDYHIYPLSARFYHINCRSLAIYVIFILLIGRRSSFNAIVSIPAIVDNFPIACRKRKRQLTGEGNDGGSDSLDEDAARAAREKGTKRTASAVQGRSSGIQVRLSLVVSPRGKKKRDDRW